MKSGHTTHPRAPREKHEMSTEIEEDDVIGPTIWEAAAEEEIQENFWCVGPPRAILILSQTSERTMSAPRTSDATHAHPTTSSPVPRILHPPTRIPRAHRPSPASSTHAHPTRSSPVPRILHPRREYHCRKNRNEGKGDAVFNNLAYLPVCNCAPVCRKGCRNPYWMWTKKK